MIKVKCLTIDQITKKLPNSPVNVDLPSNIKLADPNFCVLSKIDKMLGADHFWNILIVSQIRLSPREPILQNNLIMDLTVRVKNLSQEEHKYELAIGGIASGTVD